MARIIDFDLKSDLFTCGTDEAALPRAQLMDDQLMLATNVPGMAVEAVVQRQRAL